MKKFLEQNNIQYVRGSPYHPQSQGAVESFNRTIQNFLYLAKDMQGSEFDLNDSVYDFIMHYNNRIHTSTKFKPQEVFQNIMNEDMKKKVLENIIKSRKEAKVTQYVVDQIVRISSHFKISMDEKYVNYYKPRILSKNEKKETFKVKAKVIQEKRNCLKVVIMNDVEDQELALGKTYTVDKRADK